MGKKDNKYEFEKNANEHSKKSNDAAEIELGKFAERLGFKVAGCSEHKDTLLRYVYEHHLNIDWYDKRLRKEKFRRNLFSIISMALLALIPIGIYCLSNKKDSTEIGMPAQIAAIFTGLLGVHKSFSSWLD